MEMFTKNEDEDQQWPIHVEYASFNSSDICFTDNVNANVIKIIRAVYET